MLNASFCLLNKRVGFAQITKPTLRKTIEFDKMFYTVTYIFKNNLTSQIP